MHARDVLPAVGRRGSSPAKASLYAGAATAAVLGGLWLDTRRRVAEAERRHAPEGAFVRADGARLHYVARGQGPTVVLIHGAWMMLQDFTSSPLFERATERYRVVAIDRPGHGQSERPGRLGSPWRQARLLRAAVRALGVERPVLVGHSLGGPLSLAYAAQFPHEIAGVAFAKPRVDLTPFMVPAIPLLGGVLRNTLLQPLYRLLLPQMVRMCFAPNAVPPAFARAVPLEMMLRPVQLRATGEDFAAVLPALVGLRRQYGEIRVPVAVVAGEEDQVAYPRSHAVPLSRTLPDATLTMVPGVGHMVQHVRPDAVLGAIADVLDRAGGGHRLPGAA